MDKERYFMQKEVGRKKAGVARYIVDKTDFKKKAYMIPRRKFHNKVNNPTRYNSCKHQHTQHRST